MAYTTEQEAALDEVLAILTKADIEWEMTVDDEWTFWVKDED